MKYLITIILIALGSLLLTSIGPWWTIVIVPLLAGYITDMKVGIHLIIGFISVLLLWGLQSYFLFSSENGDLFARVGQIFGNISPIALILITAIFGGLLGGLAQVTGHCIKNLVSP